MFAPPIWIYLVIAKKGKEGMYDNGPEEQLFWLAFNRVKAEQKKGVDATYVRE